MHLSKKILHITPHLGGGVGSVVLNWIEKDVFQNIHTIISLDKNKNNDWIRVNEKCERVTIYDDCYIRSDFTSFFENCIEQNDVVVVHWWNHPLLYTVMLNYKWPECRVIAWNHVNSLMPPYSMPEKLIDFVDALVFTSPVSYECNEVKKWDDGKKEKLDAIWSTIGVESFENLERMPHDDFIVGYTGTVDFGKLNKNYIKMCADVNLPDVKFVVCSGDSQEHLVEEAKQLGVFERFSFEGRVPSVIPYLARYDVFGYPLQPQHFATCEQSLGEAMMAGCVPVVLNNPTEKYIVKHNETGIIVNTLSEYSRAIEYLYYNRDELKRLSENAKKYAKYQYDIKRTMQNWNSKFEQALTMNKRYRSWDSENKLLSPSMLYIESLGEYAHPLKQYLYAVSKDDREEAVKGIKKLFNTNSMFYSNNKGSVLLYLQFFPEDTILQEWANILKDG
ncbi:glycosyltransferase family 4 protein [Treponema primitia]|uniref:glycosyltransferase family 4 protein n=1 Tax=Treponema primitia TaxID=88058 RepID=UPI003980D962